LNQEFSAVKVGSALVRLTFHCEPCKGVLSKVSFREILHKRGVLGYFANSGKINVGDRFFVTNFSDEPIPYDVKERLKWYFRNRSHPIPATKLVYDLGLSKSYLRALPALLRKIPEIDERLVMFQSGHVER
jgi:hypothetical protein